MLDPEDKCPDTERCVAPTTETYDVPQYDDFGQFVCGTNEPSSKCDDFCSESLRMLPNDFCERMERGEDDES